MKVIGYLLVGLLAYLVFMLLLFPASPVIKRFNLAPLTLSGISGPLWNGEVAAVEAPNNVMPTGPDKFLLEDLSWRVAPLQLFTGAGAAKVGFNAYGGAGSALVAQGLGGDTTVSDLHYQSTGSALNVLLDPFLKIGGELELEVSRLVLRDQLLQSFDGTLRWRNATLEVPTEAKLGDLLMTVTPSGEKHTAEISSSGGDLALSGKVDVEKNGNFQTDITIKPSPAAPRELTDMLRGMARPSSDGSFRIRRNGNVNRLAG
ncbi:MAG: type II secretion system protein N [Gammaproteobacteria bacterium]|nr:type II secretion system protein N [Gammaproteobacteria bacterium]